MWPFANAVKARAASFSEKHPYELYVRLELTAY
jgi:hypothetical protein